MAELGALCRERGVIFHTDAVQWFGKEPFTDIHQFNADLVSLCAHKIHGPKGAGALFIRSPLQPEPLLVGGAHENERRAGTENLAAIAGLVEAVSFVCARPVFAAIEMASLSERLSKLIIALENASSLAPGSNRLKNTVSFLAKGSDSIAVAGWAGH